MTEPAPIAGKPEPVTIVCPQCGDLYEIKDVLAVLLALHMANECSIRALIRGAE